MADITFLESLQRILTMAIDKLRKAGEFSEKIYRELIDVVMGSGSKIIGNGVKSMPNKCCYYMNKQVRKLSSNLSS